MKLFRNDKTTCKDENILTIINLVVFILGILAIILRDVFSQFSSIMCISGIAMLVYVRIMSVVVEHRYAANYTSNKDKK